MADVFPDTDVGIAPIRESINSAIQELCMVNGAYKQTYHLILYADRNFYRMGWNRDHFGYVVECWDRVRKYKLERTDIYTLSRNDPWFLKMSGPPDRYFEIGNGVIGLDKTPSAHGTVLEVTCVAIPRAITKKEEPLKLRDVFQEAAAFYAVSEFYASRGDAVKATDNLMKYLEMGNLMHLHPEQAERQYQLGKENQWEPSRKA